MVTEIAIKKVVTAISMDSVTLKKKSIGLSKGKLKKTIKNVLCRPDPVLWPVISDEDEKVLRVVLSNYKIEIPTFTKLHWKELKLIPKEDRPKPPKVQKPEGFIFGVAECLEAVRNNNCSAVIVEVEVNPRLIVQPIIEACTTANVPVVCLKHLRKLSVSNFGIKTICLGVKKNHFEEISHKITELTINLKNNHNLNKKEKERDCVEIEEPKIKVSCDNGNSIEVANLLLYRKGKKSRVFVPESNNSSKGLQKLTGQDFIEFAGKTNKLNHNSFPYKKMMLKKVTNNPNREKSGKKRKN